MLIKRIYKSMNYSKFKQISTGVLLSGILLATGCTGKANSLPSSTSSDNKPKTYAKPPSMLINTNHQYKATIQTEKGNLLIELFAKDVPRTVNNFVFLTREGFYDGTTFHRVIPGFMAQGGDPTGTGSGGPGYEFADEITAHKHITGSIAMANHGVNTNGSQFFICYADQPHLDGGWSVFGQLTQGMDVLKKLTPRDPTKNPIFIGDKLIKITIQEQ
jgi:cyclophilin family peptidyl-prolyl cis-trans isomerase